MAESNLSKDDPYNKMNTAQDDIRPGFLGGSGGGEAPAGMKQRKNAEAQESLNDAEKGASQHWTEDGEHMDLGNGRFYKPDDDELEKLRKEEEGADGFYSGSDKVRGGKIKGKKRGSFSLKKSGPMLGIFGLILGIGGFMGGIQSMMPVAIEEMILEKLNSIGVSSTITSDAWLDEQLNDSMELHYRPSDCSGDLFGFSDYQIEQFRQHGIYTMKPEIPTSEGLVKITALLFLKDDTFIPVIGSDYYNNAAFNNDTLVASLKEKAQIDNIGSPISASDALNDRTFKNLYIPASKSWRGGSSGWFDRIMSNLTEIKLNITRNRWSKYATSGIKAISKKMFKKTASTEGNEKVEGKGIKDEGQADFSIEDERTESGEIERKPVVQDDGGGDSVLKQSDGASKERLKSVLSNKALKAAKKATAVADATCNIASAVMAIYGVVAGYQSLQFLNLITGFLEAVDRVKAGEIDTSPMNEYANSLTTGHATSVSDAEGEDVIVPGKENTSGMASMGMAWLFDNDNISGNDASVQNVNFEAIMNRIAGLTNIGVAATSVLSYCGFVRMAGEAFNLVTDIISICTLGIGSVVKMFIEIAAAAVIGGLVSEAISALVGYAVKEVSNLLIRDAATEWLGEDLGNALASGASKYLGGNGTSGGQGPGDSKKAMAYLSEQNIVIADEAEYQRSVRSPFDMTSKYTFLGSLAYAMIPIAYSNGGVMSILSRASSMTSTAMSKLLPTADAVAMNDGFVTEECQVLNGVGAVGDIFCNPYIITDTTTSRLSYNDVSAIVHGDRSNSDVLAATDIPESMRSDMQKNFESCNIKDGSELSKFITYCGQRTSQYGTFDASIMAQTETSTGLGKVSSILAGSGVPGVSSIAGIIAGGLEEVNVPWITGTACIASDESNINNKWGVNKYYQRYVENERLLENMDPSYVSPVSKYIDKQISMSPIDQSLEGTIARFSGMSKEDVEYGLGLIEYFEFIDEYNPSERFAFGAPVVEVEDEIDYGSENVLAGGAILPERILYADIRNRTFVV